MMKSFLQNRDHERLHKITITKTEMNQDSKKKKKENFSHNDYLIVHVLLTQKLIHVYFLKLLVIQSYNSPLYFYSVFHGDIDCYRS